MGGSQAWPSVLGYVHLRAYYDRSLVQEDPDVRAAWELMGALPSLCLAAAVHHGAGHQSTHLVAHSKARSSAAQLAPLLAACCVQWPGWAIQAGARPRLLDAVYTFISYRCTWGQRREGACLRCLALGLIGCGLLASAVLRCEPPALGHPVLAMHRA
jgi:hypothetical protein